jgi:cytochrome c-type biogenesis protein CcmH
MTSFVFLSALLAALALLLLLRRTPARADGPGTPADAAIAATRPSRGLGLTLAGIVLVVALGGYAWVGSPKLLPVTPGAFGGDSPTPESTAAGEAIAATLHERALQHPQEAMAWYQWARAEIAAGRMSEAVEGYRRALELRPKDPDLLADAADVMAVAAGGHLEGEPMQLVDRALAADPNHVKALALKGSYLITQHDVPGALAAWKKAMKSASPDDPIAAYIAHQVEALRAMAAGMATGMAPPGPAASTGAPGPAEAGAPGS